jgi:hypothetical protein
MAFPGIRVSFVYTDAPLVMGAFAVGSPSGMVFKRFVYSCIDAIPMIEYCLTKGPYQDFWFVQPALK